MLVKQNYIVFQHSHSNPLSLSVRSQAKIAKIFAVTLFWGSAMMRIQSSPGMSLFLCNVDGCLHHVDSLFCIMRSIKC